MKHTRCPPFSMSDIFFKLNLHWKVDLFLWDLRIHVITQMAYTLRMVLLKLSLLNCCDLKVYFSISGVVCMMLADRSDIKFSFMYLSSSQDFTWKTFVLPFMAQLPKSKHFAAENSCQLCRQSFQNCKVAFMNTVTFILEIHYDLIKLCPTLCHIWHTNFLVKSLCCQLVLTLDLWNSFHLTNCLYAVEFFWPC